MNILCKLGNHSFERLSKPVPTRKYDDDFTFVVGFFALGRCKRCSKLEMVECPGYGEPYYMSEVKTKGEWRSLFVQQLFMKVMK